MEIFGFVKLFLIQIGMYKAKHINGKFYQTIGLLVTGAMLSYAVCTMAWYFAFEAISFEQHAEALLWIVLFSCTSSKFCIFCRQHIGIMEFIHKIENIIENRMYLIVNEYFE